MRLLSGCEPCLTYQNVPKCNVCTNRLLNYKQYLQCSNCTNHSHNKCNFLTKSEGDNILSHASSLADWICYTCKLNIFPFFGSSQDSNTNTNTNTINIINKQTQKCNSCKQPLGRKITKCTFCDKNIHSRCGGDLGCTECIADIFPASTELFHHTSNTSIFNPYKHDSIYNNIGDEENIYSESKYWKAVSNNLNNCKYTTLSKFKNNKT